jgi:DNA polymerase III alpha subunit (gram-positive type)
MPYAVIPDVKVFMENLKRSSKTLETHLAFLSDHLNYFQAPVTEKGFLINGLIRNSDFLNEFDSYRREAKEIDDPPSNMGLLSPITEESAISAVLHDLEKLHFSFKEDVEALYRCMKFLNKASHHYIKELRGKARGVRDEFDVRIKEQEELVAPKVAHLKEDYDSQIIDSSKAFERQRLPLQKEKVKLEKSRDQALARIERYKLEAKTHAEKDDSAGEQKWKEKGNEVKKEVSDLENQLKTTDKALKDLEERKSLEIIKLRSELENKIKEARKELLELESSRDAKVLIYKQEAEKLDKQTKLIIDQIGRTAKLRETGIAQFEKLGIKKDSDFPSVALVFVPFYIVCYQVETRKRYLILPPSVANSIGLSTKLKGALGRARIKQLLIPRFATIASLMDTIQVLAQQSAVFETEIRELGEKTNILNSSLVREDIKKGLSYIKSEGWLSDKELEALSQKIV